MPTTPDPSTELTVATLNVCGLPSILAPLRVRVVGIGRWLEESTVDVVGFQEVWTYRALVHLRSALPSFRYVAWRRGYVGPAGGLATFSRRPTGTVSFTSFGAARVGSGGVVFRARQTLNSHLQGVLTVGVGGFRIGNTHLTANRDGDWSVGSRHATLHRTQLAVLHRVARDVDVVSGDFNVPSGSHLYPSVVGAYMDPFAAADPVTYHAAFLGGRPSSRIDYVLVSKRRTVADSAVVFPEPVEGTYLSDHVGLRVTVH
jgi:exonuclease III